MKRNFLYLVLIGIFFTGLPCFPSRKASKIVTIDDFSQLNKTAIQKLVTPATYTELATIVAKAGQAGTKISIAGTQHSQGGQSFCPNGIVISLKRLNKILELDREKQTITVQAGASWHELQEFLNPHNFAVKIMQFANIFTIGGSLSVNANGIDPYYGPLIESVRSIKIMLFDGSIVAASRTENAELFRLAIGGYGLFGIILEATLDVVENSLYQREAHILSLSEYIDFSKIVKNRETHGFHYAHLKLTPQRKKLFSDVVCLDFRKIDENKFKKNTIKNYKKLRQEKFIEAKKFEIIFLRESSFIKSIQWIPEVIKHGKISSRNNIMGPPATHTYCKSSTKTQLLQEYFIPVDKLDDFIKSLEFITKKLNTNLMHVALRFIPKNTESFLSYTRTDCIGVVVLLSQKITPQASVKTAQWTQYLINSAIDLGGTYYLPIQLHATNSQIRKAYPKIDNFFTLKKQYDPEEIFINHLYQKYAN